MKINRQLNAYHLLLVQPRHHLPPPPLHWLPLSTQGKRQENKIGFTTTITVNAVELRCDENN